MSFVALQQINNGTTPPPPCERIFFNKKCFKCVLFKCMKNLDLEFSFVDVYILQIDNPLVLLDFFVNCFVVQLFALGFLSASPWAHVFLPCIRPLMGMVMVSKKFQLITLFVTTHKTTHPLTQIGTSYCRNHVKLAKQVEMWMKEKKKKKKRKCDLVTTLFHSLLGNGKSPQPLKLPNIKKEQNLKAWGFWQSHAKERQAYQQWLHPCPQQFTLHESVDDGPSLTHPLSQTWRNLGTNPQPLLGW